LSGRFRPFVRSRSPGGGTAPDLPAWTKLAPRAIAPTRTGLLGRRSLKAREVRFESLLGGPTSPRVRRFAGYGAGFGETDFACRTLARGRQTTGADAPLACLDEARRSRAKSGWEAGIRTPITWFRATRSDLGGFGRSWDLSVSLSNSASIVRRCGAASVGFVRRVSSFFHEARCSAVSRAGGLGRGRPRRSTAGATDER
jgi:hypothetical protein